MTRGALVVFEGGEGAGKSTQLRRLAARLDGAGVAHHVFREPGGTVVGDRIRDILLHSETELAATTEAALFIASRAELVATAVEPALERGEHVLLDRFLLSTYAYQVHGRGLREADVRAANHLATGGLVPDLTLLLTLPVADGLARARARGTSDRMERADRAFHERVAAAFGEFASERWQGAHPECGPIVDVAGGGGEATVEAEISRVLAQRLPELVSRRDARAEPCGADAGGRPTKAAGPAR